MKAIRESEWFGGSSSRTVKVSPHATSGLGLCADAGRLRRHPRGRRCPPSRRSPTVRPRAGRRGHPARRARRPRPPAGRLARWPQRAEELGVPVLKPEHPRDPEFQEALRALRPDCCPVVAYGALLPAVRARHPARTAGSTCTSRCCPPGAAPRRCSTRSGPATRSPARPPSGSSRSSTPGPTYGLMTETDPARPTPPATCSRGSPRAAPGCWWPPSTASRTARWRPASSRPTGVSLAPKITVEDAHVDWTEPAVAVDRRIRACTPGPGRLVDVRRRADQARPGRARSADERRWRPACSR